MCFIVWSWYYQLIEWVKFEKKKIKQSYTFDVLNGSRNKTTHCTMYTIQLIKLKMKYNSQKSLNAYKLMVLMVFYYLYVCKRLVVR